MFFYFFGQNFQKYCQMQKFEKPFLELCLNMVFKLQAILAFLTQNYFFLACHKIFWPK